MDSLFIGISTTLKQTICVEDVDLKLFSCTTGVGKKTTELANTIKQ